MARPLLRAALIVAGLAAVPVLAQDTPEEGADDNGFIINLLEDQLSTETRKIRLSGVEGVLSSSATVKLITISDPEGIWLRIENAEIVWNRSALFRRAVDIETLSAETISVPRAPIPDEDLPAPEARGLEVPELPVSISLEELSVARLELGEDLIGFDAALELAGSMQLADGAIEAALEMDRLDGPGGRFDLGLDYSNTSRELDLRLDVEEPPDGIVANLLSMEGRPAVDFSIEAVGPVEDLSAGIDFRADGEDLLDGELRLSRPEGRWQVGLDLAGRIQPLIDPSVRPFFAAESTIRARGRELEDGGIAIDELEIDSGGLRLSARATTTPDRFLETLTLDATVGREDGGRLVLPLGAGEDSIGRAQLALDYGEAGRWSGMLGVDALETGGIEVGEVDIDMGGIAENLQDPETRRVTAQIEGAATGLDAARRDLAQALGERIDLAIRTEWQAGQPVRIRQARIDGNGLALTLDGAVEDLAFDGAIGARIADLAPLSALLDRDLSGGLSVETTGRIAPLTGAFDLTLSGTAEDLGLGDATLDALLAGQTDLSGGLSRGEDGIRARDFVLENPQARIEASGIYATERTDFGLSAELTDIAVMTGRGSGPLEFRATADGTAEMLDLDLTLAMPEGRLLDREVSDLRLGFDASGPDLQRMSGVLSGTGLLDGTPAFLGGRLILGEHLDVLKGFVFDFGDTSVDGTIGRGGDGLLAGTVEIRSSDISEPAALFLVDAEGAIDARLTLSREAGTQRAALRGELEGIEVDGTAIGRADVDMQVSDIFGLPLADGTLSASGAVIAGYGIDRLFLSSDRAGAEMDVTATADLANGTALSLAGRLSDLDPGFALGLTQLRVENGPARAVLSRPAALRVVGQSIRLEDLALDVNGGSLTADGQVNGDLDVDLDIRSVPLDIANAIVPDLAAAGTVTGTARLRGTRDAPEIAADLDATGLTARPLVQAGLPPLDLTLDAETRNGLAELDATLRGGDAFAARAGGVVPLDPQARRMDMRVELDRFALALVDRLIGQPGLSGSVTGTAAITGAPADPTVDFDATGEGVSLRALADNGLGPLAVTARGSYARNALDLASATARGPTGLNLSAQGRVPLAGGGLDVALDGSVPLSAADVALAGAGTQLSGTLSLDARMTGRLANPSFSGSLTVPDGTLVDPARNIRIDALALDARLDGDRLVLNRLGGRLAQGGTVSLTGSITLSPARNYPADLTLALRDAVYSDGRLITTEASGRLRLDGPITGGGQVAGTLNVARAEILVPSGFGINEGVLLDVRHLDPPADVTMTLERADLRDGVRDRTPPAGRLGLDVRINAPNQIFIRGRGLDAELGGRLRVRGTLADVQPVGQIELIRGRLNILGQRIDFDEGFVTLTGSFDPRIRLVAATDAGADTTVIITIEGPASDPQISFTSVPPLPEDEVLALLVFGRNLADLSPVQVAQLAAAAATLSGGGGGLANDLRAGLGLANLDLTTDEEGGIGVRAGAYLDDNIYLDVETGSNGDTRATINLDITDSVRARASVDNRGESSIGIFFERDY